MSTYLYITVPAPTGKLLWGRVRNPNGTTAAEAAVTETAVGSKVYQHTFTPTLADTVDPAAPCDVEVREGTDAASFNANTDKVWMPKLRFWVKGGAGIENPILGTIGGGGSTTLNQQETINEVDERISQ